AVGAHWIEEEKRGSILNMVATYAWDAGAGVIHSAAAKAGVLSMTRTLAVEWGAKYGIRANAIAPGPIERTGGSEKLMLSPEMVKKVKDSNPLHRFGTPEEIAGLAAFIFSEDASYIHGEVITMDGGIWLNDVPDQIQVSERGQVMPGTKKNRHFTWEKITLYSGGLLILLVAGALIYVNHFLNKSLPQVEGEIEMPVSEHVSVTTDDVG